MSSIEFAEWKAFSELHPFGEERADFRNAMLCEVVSNILPGKGKRQKLKDFMPKFDRARRHQSNDEIRKTIIAFAEEHNARLKAGMRPR